jgi:hypothetical protein
MGGIIDRKLIGIANAKDITTEEDVAKFTMDLEAVMLKNKYDNDPHMTLTCVGYISADGKYDTPEEEIRRQIESHASAVTDGIFVAAEAESHKDR